MGWLLVFTSFLLCTFSKIFYKKIYNPLTVMTAFWCIISFFSIVGLYNQQIASDKVYFICLLGIIGFSIGHFLGTTKRIVFSRDLEKLNCRISNSDSGTLRVNIKIINIVLIILIIILAFRVERVMSLLDSGYIMGSIRVDFNNIVLHSSLERAANTFIIMPLIYLLPVIVIPEYVIFRKNLKSFILLAICITLFSVCDGGRAPFFYCAIYFVLSSMIFYSKNHQGKRNKVKKTTLLIRLLFIIFTVYMMSYLSTIRAVNYTLGNSIYSYFTGCFPLLDYHITRIDSVGTWTYGAAFFHGLLNIFFYIINSVGFLSYPAFYNIANELGDVSAFINIGSANYNAFVTPYFYFYLDFRYLGVIFGSLFYGILASKSYQSIIKNFDYRTLAIFLLIMQSIFTSMVRWQFYNANFTLAFVFLFLIPKEKKKEFWTKLKNYQYKIYKSKVLANIPRE